MVYIFLTYLTKRFISLDRKIILLINTIGITSFLVGGILFLISSVDLPEHELKVLDVSYEETAARSNENYVGTVTIESSFDFNLFLDSTEHLVIHIYCPLDENFDNWGNESSLYLRRYGEWSIIDLEQKFVYKINLELNTRSKNRDLISKQFQNKTLINGNECLDCKLIFMPYLGIAKYSNRFCLPVDKPSKEP